MKSTFQVTTVVLSFTRPQFATRRGFASPSFLPATPYFSDTTLANTLGPKASQILGSTTADACGAGPPVVVAAAGAAGAAPELVVALEFSIAARTPVELGLLPPASGTTGAALAVPVAPAVPVANDPVPLATGTIGAGGAGAAEEVVTTPANTPVAV